ncbi:hypothetical protein [Paenibacillus eucommiae]|uniref:Uncharacterized protein n=1 Tax=Paenibacillus eucommiae TaxID=1355755 RepID=A0ABS4IRY7_9BACL|nr:hypothetical protein [Paenibacillus eucommiae]MBP1990305.1 hypothetical protein [Paenibacillus eucommiae]
MKAVYKGILLEGTPQEILFFIHLMDGPSASKPLAKPFPKSIHGSASHAKINRANNSISPVVNVQKALETYNGT